MKHSRLQKKIPEGFTLIEMIAVLVILGIVAAIGSNFVVSTINSYNDVQSRSKLVNRGRLVIEQITRQIRQSLPNSVRVSPSGLCVEFMPLAGGATYLSPVPDSQNLAAATNTLNTAPFTIDFGTARHIVVGALDASEIYATGSPNGRVNAGTLGAGPPYASAELGSNHRFIRNSVNQRLFLADNPLRVCLVGTQLFQYSNYGFSTAALNDANPGGSADLMAEQVSTGGIAFALSQGTEDVNTSLNVDLLFAEGTNQITLRQDILIRNVP